MLSYRSTFYEYTRSLETNSEGSWLFYSLNLCDFDMFLTANHTLLWSFQMCAMWLQLWNLEQVCHTLKVCTWVAIYMFEKALDIWERFIPDRWMILFFLRRHASACVWPKESGVSFLTKLDAEELWFTLIKVWLNKKCQKLKSSKRIILKIWCIYFDIT